MSDQNSIEEAVGQGSVEGVSMSDWAGAVFFPGEVQVSDQGADLRNSYVELVPGPATAEESIIVARWEMTKLGEQALEAHIAEQMRACPEADFFDGSECFDSRIYDLRSFVGPVRHTVNYVGPTRLTYSVGFRYRSDLGNVEVGAGGGTVWSPTATPIDDEYGF